MSALSSPVSVSLGDDTPDHRDRSDAIAFFSLMACVLALYLRTAHFGFVQFDDQFYVYQNPQVLGGMSFHSLRWAVTTIIKGNWHPLTMVTELVIATVFGPTAGAFHLSNAFLHSINVGMLYLFLRRSTGQIWPAFFTAALWGLHPLRVESVAWISELKDVLCGAFWLGSMLAYLRYSRRRTVLSFAPVLLLHAMALLAKPMATTLPATLLLLDYWPIPRNGGQRTVKWWSLRVLERLPLFALSITDIIVALHTQQTTSAEAAIFPPGIRFRNALIGYLTYLRDIFFPIHPAVFYPHPAMVGAAIPIYLAALAAACIIAMTIVVAIRRAQPWLAVGWLWYLGTLLPVIGFVQLGAQARADRYTYIPSIGITIAVVWSIDACLTSRSRHRLLVGGALASLVLVLSVRTFRTIGHWKNSSTLFGYLREVQPDNFLALSYYCQELANQGKIDESLQAGRRATQVAPKSADAHAAYGTVLWMAGQLDEATSEFIAALSLDRGVAEYWDGLGTVRSSQADQRTQHHDAAAEKDLRLRAIGDFGTAIDLDPDLTLPREHLARQLLLVGRQQEAIATWEKVIEINPNDSQAQGELAMALLAKGETARAVRLLRAAIIGGSKNPDWETKLAFLTATDPRASLEDVEQLVAVATDARDQTGGKDPAALDALAACLARVGRFDDAVATANSAVAQARRTKNAVLAKQIELRLAKYQNGLPYFVGDQ